MKKEMAIVGLMALLFGCEEEGLRNWASLEAMKPQENISVVYAQGEVIEISPHPNGGILVKYAIGTNLFAFTQDDQETFPLVKEGDSIQVEVTMVTRTYDCVCGNGGDLFEVTDMRIIKVY